MVAGISSLLLPLNSFNCPLPLEKSVGEVFQGVHTCAFLKLTSPALCLFWGQSEAPGLGRDLNQLVSIQQPQRGAGRSTHIACAPPDRPRQISLSNVTHWSSSIGTTRRLRDRRAGDCCHRSARPIRSTWSPLQARIGMASLEIDELPVRPQHCSKNWEHRA